MTANLLDTATVLVVLAAGFAYLNHRFLALPFTIGLVVSALTASVAVLVLDALAPSLGLGDAVRQRIAEIDFTEALMRGMLGFLLFAGALHVNLDDLFEAKTPVLVLASVGVLISTVIVGVGAYGLFQLAHIPVPFVWCLVFGALISPTDPVAVLGILKSAGAPRALEVKVAGESLFNDGVGVIVFTVLVGVASGSSLDTHGAAHAAASVAQTAAHAAPGAASAGHAAAGFDWGHVLAIFGQEVIGGVLLGLALGLTAYAAMRSVEEPNLEILFSVALVMAISLVAAKFHTSAPLGCVVAGLFIGNRGRRMAMGEEVRQALDLVWSFIDEGLNAVLFLLVGLEVVAVSLAGKHLVAALLVIPLALFARFVAVGVPVSLMRWRHEFTPGAIRVLTWGGIKGGISVALALSLPQFPGRPAVLTATYAVVIFSIIVQGLTMRRLVRGVTGEASGDSSHPEASH